MPEPADASANETESRTGEHGRHTPVHRMLQLGGVLAVLAIVLGAVGITASTPLLWAFGVGTAAVSVLAATGYHHSRRGHSA